MMPLMGLSTNISLRTFSLIKWQRALMYFDYHFTFSVKVNVNKVHIIYYVHVFVMQKIVHGIDLPPNWSAFQTEQGNTYYVNSVTKGTADRG